MKLHFRDHNVKNSKNYVENSSFAQQRRSNIAVS